MTNQYELKLAKRQASEKQLIENLRATHATLTQLFNENSSHWIYEDSIYRFYHQSFKVYMIQEATEDMVGALKALLRDCPLNVTFMEIVSAGTGKIFQQSDNQNWDQAVRPMLEAFFHARYFLEMAVRYGDQFTEPPQMLPSGWASLLYLYNLR